MKQPRCCEPGGFEIHLPDVSSARTHRGHVALIAVALAILLAGCATQYAPDRVNHPYGFLFGYWHGLIAPFALLAKLVSWLLSLAGISFLHDVTIFGKPNTGFFYYIGFVLGLGTLGASQAAD